MRRWPVLAIVLAGALLGGCAEDPPRQWESREERVLKVFEGFAQDGKVLAVAADVAETGSVTPKTP